MDRDGGVLGEGRREVEGRGFLGVREGGKGEGEEGGTKQRERRSETAVHRESVLDGASKGKPRQV